MDEYVKALRILSLGIMVMVSLTVVLVTYGQPEQWGY